MSNKKTVKETTYTKKQRLHSFKLEAQVNKNKLIQKIKAKFRKFKLWSK